MCIGSLSATWSTPVDIAQGDPKAGLPELAVDANGNVTAVWGWYNGSNGIIQSSAKLLGGNWQEPPVSLSQAGQDASEPQIAVDANGNATAVWMGYNGSNTIIQSSTKPFGGIWQATPDNLSQISQDARSPQIAVGANGNATAVWVRYDGNNWIVQSSTKPFGGIWQATPNNLSQIGQDASEPQIAVDASGNATAVWVRYNGSNRIIQSSTKPFGGIWQATPDNLSQISQDARSPQIAVGANGNATAVWVRYDGNNWIVQSSTKLFGGSWQTSPDNLSQPGQDASEPQIAVDANGNATAVWEKYNGSNLIIQSSTKPFGGIWQATPDNLSQVGQDAHTPQIAVDASGNAAAVWDWYNGSNTIIQSSTKPFGGSWQVTPDNLSQTGQDAHSPQIVVDAYRNSTAVWVRRDGNDWIVQSSSNFFGPTITLLNPSSGATVGGNSVTITGTDFVDVTSVLFGSTPATSFSVVSPTTIIAIVPPGTGVVDVRVIASSMTSPIVATDQYAYQPTSPTHFRGTGKHSKKKLLLKTNWKKSTTSNVARYEIFARDQRIEIISASKKPKSTIHLNPRHKHHLTKKYRLYLHDKYKIRAVDSFGTPSSFTNIKVKH
jgi:hypothetical protein